MALNSEGEDSATNVVSGLSISLNVEIISKVTTLPLGVQWCKEDKAVCVTLRKNFFIHRENPIEDKNGVRRESLPYPWDEVVYHILKQISCEGRLSIVYAYHFRLLHELLFKEELPTSLKLGVPHLLLQSIFEMSQKLREGKHKHISHDGLIKLIVMDALIHLRNPLLWTDFVDIHREIFIETQAITSTWQEETPTSSIRGREKEEAKTKKEEPAKTKE